MYRVKEIFYTLQGEGFWVGTPSIFIRFVGCNMWSGLESGRKNGKAACALWCDTDFTPKHGMRLTVQEIIKTLEAWDCHRLVLSGGEPLLQVDASLVDALRSHGYTVSIETNGSMDTSLSFDWITLSPKLPHDQIRLNKFNEIKFVLPHYHPSSYLGLLEKVDPLCVFLQPESQSQESTAICIREAQKYGYRLSLQMHKYIGVA
jgi:organic radical activating enzyme